jgi:O-antigen/teichoic acid export membrane protein
VTSDTEGAGTAGRERQLVSSAVYLLPVVVGSVVPLATLPIFTRVLTTEEYGAWALAMAYAAFATGVANLGLTIGYERNFFEYRAPLQQPALLYSVVGFVTAAFVLVGVGTWLFRVPLARWIVGSGDHGGLLFSAYCANVVTSVKAYYLIYFRNTEDARAYAWYSIDETVLAAVFSVFFVAWMRLGAMGLVLGHLAAGLLILALVVRRVSATLKPAFDRALLQDSLRISLPLTPRIFLGVVGSNFDKYLIGLLATVGGVGVYSIGQRVSYLAFQYMTAIENVFTPQVYQRMFGLGNKGGASIGRYLTPFAYVSVGVSLLIAIFSEELLIVLTPQSYHGAIPIVALLAMSYGIMFFAKMPQLTYARKTFVTSILTVVSLGLNIALNVVMIPRWGALGAAAGTLIAGVLSGAVAFAVRQHYYRIAWEYRRLAAMFGLFMGGSLAAIVLFQAGADYWLRLLVKVGVVGTFAWLGVRLGYLTWENYGMVRQMLLARVRPKPAGAGA